MNHINYRSTSDKNIHLPRHLLLTLLIISPALGLNLALAAPAATAPKKIAVQLEANTEFKAPCGVLKKHEGILKILDATKTQLISTKPQTGIPCGAWISLEEGWAEIKHQNGPTLHFGPHTFAQLTGTQGDQLILFRGQVYANVADGNPELKMVSEVGRARVKNGKVILISDHVDNETQLVVLENTATLENRFQSGRKVAVRAGETSSLHFKLMRVIPSSPSAVSVASLKPKLFELQIPEKVQDHAIEVATARYEKGVLPHPSTGKLDHAVAKSEPTPEGSEPHSHRKNQDMNMRSRAIASESTSRSKSIGKLPGLKAGVQEGRAGALNPGPLSGGDPPRPEEQGLPRLDEDSQKESEEENEEESGFQKRMIEKATGGAPVSKGILFPDSFYGKSQKIQVRAEAAKMNPKFRHRQQAEEEAEKKRLLKELSRIHAD